jgi:hypothetical protein
MIQQVTDQSKPFFELVRCGKSPKHQEPAQVAGHAVVQIDSTSFITAIRTLFMDVLSISAFCLRPSYRGKFAGGLRRPAEVVGWFESSGHTVSLLGIQVVPTRPISSSGLATCALTSVLGGQQSKPNNDALRFRHCHRSRPRCLRSGVRRSAPRKRTYGACCGW